MTTLFVSNLPVLIHRAARQLIRRIAFSQVSSAQHQGTASAAQRAEGRISRPRIAQLASIIIPCFNGERFVADAIRSALSQTYQPLEVIVVDDGSTDASAAVLDSFGSRIKVVRQSNSGLPAARNAGIGVSTGSYVAFLDCDDYWDPDFVARMVAALEGSGASIAYCGWQNVGLSGARADPFIPLDYESDPQKLLHLLSGVRWPVHAALMRYEVVDEVGGFETSWTSCEDFAFWLRAAISRRLVRVPEVLAFYRHHGTGQMTRNRGQLALNYWRVQRQYIHSNPAIKQRLSRRTLREITHGALLKRGYTCFWNRDLDGAQAIFRTVIRTGYGSPRDWVYLMPAMLPLRWYRRLVRRVDDRQKTDGGR